MKANGKVERFMKTIKKTIKAADVENKSSRYGIP